MGPSIDLSHPWLPPCLYRILSATSTSNVLTTSLGGVKDSVVGAAVGQQPVCNCQVLLEMLNGGDRRIEPLPVLFGLSNEEVTG